MIAIRILNLAESAHGSTSGGTSLLGAQSPRTGFSLERVEVKGPLRVQVGIEPAPAKHVHEAPPHHLSPAGFARNLAMRATVNSQLFVSS